MFYPEFGYISASTYQKDIFMRQAVSTVVVPFVAMLLVACGGSGGGNGASPTVSIVFPPADSIFTATTLTVRGTATDADGNIIAVRANGQPAEGSSDWSAQVQLVPGANNITIAVEDNDGNETQANVAIKRSVSPFGTLGDIKLDPENGRAFLLDSELRTLFAVDLDSGERSVVSGQGRGAGADIIYPERFELDLASGRAFVTDSQARAIYAIDIETGDREVVSSAARGTGPALGMILDIAVEPDGERLLVSDRLWKVIAVDADTGNRSIYSSVDTHAGPSYDQGYPTAIVADAANSRVIAGTSHGSFVAIGGDGNRTLIYDGFTAPGPLVNEMVLDASVNTIHVVSSGGYVDSFRLDDLTWDVLYDGEGVIARAWSLALDAAGGQLFLPMNGIGVGVLEIASGDAAVIADSDDATVGSGEDLLERPKTVFDVDAGRAYMLDEHSNLIEIRAVDFATGSRSALIEDSSFGYVDRRNIVLDKAGDRLLVLNSDGRLIGVALSTGEAQLLAEDVPYFDSEGSPAIDAAGNRFLYGDYFTRGIRSVSFDDLGFSSIGTVGGFPNAEFGNLGAGDLDLPRNRYVSLFYNPELVVATDLSSGESEVLIDLEAEPIDGVELLNDIDIVGDDAYATDMYTGNLWRIDLATGEMHVVAGDHVGEGNSLGRPWSLEVDGGRGIAWVHDEASIAIIAIDITTGDRVIVNR